ncbi:MAG: hypothetical protein ACOCZ8_04140 [Bacteroidota bacterium]
MSANTLSKLTLVLLAAMGLLLSACNDDDDDDDDTLAVYETTSETQPGPDGTDRNVIIVNGTPEGIGSANETWSKDNIYVLNGLVFVQEGQSLKIEPGTVIKGRPTPTNGSVSSALVVARGGSINAAGTPTEPIIFTSEIDDVSDPTDLTGSNLRGQWGGVVILGRATTNTSANPDNNIEGIEITEARGLYGGDNDADNSGVFKYVSIRHGGQEIGPGNEINGLTMGAVGSGTEINHVEVIYNTDDGFEWFGGTVNTSHLVAAFCGDDAYDYDQGWRGQNQFLYAVQGAGSTGDGGEHDGGTDPETGTPYSTPVFYNVTYQTVPSLNTRLFNIRDNAGGKYFNSVFAGFARSAQIEDLESGEDTWNRYITGDLELISNVWESIGGEDGVARVVGTTDSAELAANTQTFIDYLLSDDAGPNIVSTGNLTNYSDAVGAKELDPRPVAGSDAAAAGAAVRAEYAFIQDVNYRGAFEPGQDLWLRGWTFLDEADYIVD